MYTLKLIVKTSTLCAALIFVIGFAPSPFAQDDSVFVTYQGYLTDAAGDPVTGTRSITFTIYDSTGTPIWSQSHPEVPVNDGQFSAVIGGSLGFVDGIYGWGGGLELGIRVDDDDELVPRTPLTSVFHAVASKKVVGDIITLPGQLVIPSSDGDSGIVMTAGNNVRISMVKPVDDDYSSFITSALRDAGGTDIGVAASEFYTEDLYGQDVHVGANA
ncbi:MAG: hypothetical protein JSU65_02100, partial [Candidatus Zixiibacteriota bacterium]